MQASLILNLSALASLLPALALAWKRPLARDGLFWMLLAVAVGDLTLTFQRVETDSRCPIDAVCVWSGDAEIALRIQQGAQAAVAALHTHVEPRRTVWNGYNIQFVSLAPSQRASVPLDPSEYRAQLLVERPQ